MRKIVYAISLFLILMLFLSAVNAVELDSNQSDMAIGEKDNVSSISIVDGSYQSHMKSALYASDDTISNESEDDSKEITDIQMSYQDNLMVGQTNRIWVYNLPADVKGNTYVYDSNTDSNYTVSLRNGRGYVDIKMVLGANTGDLGPELYNYYIVARFEGDDHYEASTTDALFRVYKYYPNLQMHYNDISLGEVAVIRFTLERDAKGYVLLTVNGKDYRANVSNGEAVIHIHNLSKGKYVLTAAYFGDEKYDWDYANGVLTVRGYGFKNTQKISNNVFYSKARINLSNKITGNPVLILLLSLISVSIVLKRK